MPRSFTQEEYRLIAGLKNDPSFILLLDFLETKISDETENLLNVKDDKEALLKLREWQNMKKTFDILRNAPEDIAIDMDVANFDTLTEPTLTPSPRSIYDMTQEWRKMQQTSEAVDNLL